MEFNPFSREAKLLFKEAEDSLVLGVLAGPEDSYPSLANEKQGITMNSKQTGILMFIKPISPEPAIIQQYDSLYNSKSPLYIARPKSDLGTNLPVGYHLNDDQKKIEMLRSKFKGKIITFSPVMTTTTENDRIYKNVKVVNCGEEWREGAHYEAIPRITSFMPDELDKLLLSDSEIELPNCTFYEFGPSYILCDNYLYHIKSLWRRNSNHWIANNPTQIEYIELEDGWEQHHIYGTDKIFFLETDFLDQLINKKWEVISNSIRSKNKNEFIEEALVEPIKMVEKRKLVEEYQFLDYLMYLTKQRGLGYSMDTLVNFHVSVKTNDVTILSGMSGTGKSQLAVIYAEALGIKKESMDESRFLVVPIRPSFTQPEDLMGYLNASTGLFVPSDTGLVDLLVKASRDLESMYMVLFDEMNLAQVEHWFAPFISLLELPNDEQRVIQLYSSNQMCHNKHDYPDKILLGDNIIFLGTANMDETTRGFSDRLLDRVNIVVPEKMSFTTFVEDRDKFDDDYGIDFIEDFGKISIYKKWVSEGDLWKVFQSDELRFFDELHEMIHKADNQKGVSFRTLKKVAEFIRSVPKDSDGNSYLARDEIIDLQVKQRILTKIRGSSEQFRELIGEAIDEGILESQLMRHFTSEQAQKISGFTKSLAEIKRKARELYMYEYAN